jgi:GNAT superfamily N-acetyltransferase
LDLVGDLRSISERPDANGGPTLASLVGSYDHNAMYLIHPCAPDHPDAMRLLDHLSETIAAITGSSGRGSFDLRDVSAENSLFVIAEDSDSIPVGCGAYRPLAPSIAELKRMYASPGTKGLGAAILKSLEHRAAGDGYQELWPETRQINVRAISFYERQGYGRIPNFGKYIGRSEAVCFGKRLPAQRSGASP